MVLRLCHEYVASAPYALALGALTFFGYSLLNYVLKANEETAPSKARDRALHFSWAAFVDAAAAAAVWRMFRQWEVLTSTAQLRLSTFVTFFYVCNYAWLVFTVSSFEDIGWTDFPQNRGGEQAL